MRGVGLFGCMLLGFAGVEAMTIRLRSDRGSFVKLRPGQIIELGPGESFYLDRAREVAAHAMADRMGFAQAWKGAPGVLQKYLADYNCDGCGAPRPGVPCEYCGR